MRWLWRTGSMMAIGALSCGDDGGSAATTDGPATGGTEAATSTADTSPPDDTGPPDDTTGDTGPDPTADTGPPPTDCGDGILDGIEECDDGNAIDGDGCDSDCTLNLDTSLWQVTQGGAAMVRESGQGIAIDGEGNVLVVGYVVDVIGDPDVWLAKYDPEGNEIWARTYDPSGGLDDRGYAVALDPTDNILVVGDVDVAPTISDIWVAKLDPDGNEIWSTSYDGPDAGDDGGRGVVSDSAGNVSLTGFVRVGSADMDVFVAQLDPAGALRWTYVVAGSDQLDDRGQAIDVDASDNVVVAGFHSYAGFNRNVWLRKYDPDGNALWTDEWDSPTMADDAGFGVTVAPDGSIVVAGMTPVVADNQDVWLGRWDGDGALQWIKQFGGQAYVNDQGLAIASDADSNLVVVGYRGMSATDSDIWMRKYDIGGNVVWTQAVVGPGLDRDQATAVAIDGDANVYATGEIRQAMNNDGDIWIGKFAPR